MFSLRRAALPIKGQESARKVLQLLKGQAENRCVRLSEGQSDFCLFPGQQICKDGSAKTNLSFLSFNDHSLSFQLSNVQAKEYCMWKPNFLKELLGPQRFTIFSHGKNSLIKRVHARPIMAKEELIRF